MFTATPRSCSRFPDALIEAAVGRTPGAIGRGTWMRPALHRTPGLVVNR